MEVAGAVVQQIEQPPNPGTNNNLWEPRDDGAIESDQPQYVRRQSLYLEAQMRPGRAAVAGLAFTSLALAILRRRRTRILTR